jgi:UDP-glucuronate 4-epimerase
MTILLTGCAGFIGARVGEMLLAEGHRVAGVDNLNDYYDVRLKRHRLGRLTTARGFEFHETDIEDRAALEKLFSDHQFEAVINLAARAGVRASIDSPRVYLTTNALGALNLLELMTEHGVSRFVMASTSSLYAGATMPFLETADVTHPISPYAATKLAAEALAQTWHHLYGLHVAILRYFTVYGPAGRPDMSPFRFIEWVRRGEPIRLFGDGSQTRDFTYIDDIARGTIAALNVEGCRVLNLGGGNEPLSIRGMIEIIEDALSKKARVEHLPQNQADMQDTSANISKARKLLGWQPEVSPQEGLRAAVVWHQKNAGWLDQVRL